MIRLSLKERNLLITELNAIKQSYKTMHNYLKKNCEEHPTIINRKKLYEIRADLSVVRNLLNKIINDKDKNYDNSQRI